MLFDTALAEGIKLIRDITTDKDQQAILEANYRAALLSANKELAIAQIEVNKTEALSSDNFTRRWRPFVGWTCGVAFAYHFIIQPFMVFILAAFGVTIMLPAFDIDSLYTVLMGLLGLSSLRTVEKIKGTVNG